MIKKIKNNTKKLMALIIVFGVLLTYFVPIKSVKAVIVERGEGTECFIFDMDAMGFPYSSVTIDGYEWDKDNDYRYYSNENVHTIVIKAGKLNDEYPWISTAGGLDDYKIYSAIDNPNEDPNVEGDEYLLTLVINNLPYSGQCNNFGISLAPGPFPVLPEIAAVADVTIRISGDELEYHYVEDKPNEADVTYFKFGINSGISEDIVPFTFGNANYVHNDNEPSKNVSSVNTKQPIHYEYTYDGTGYVTFYINGGGTDEYTKIEINGVDYSDQAPHTQIEVFEHLQGWASVFEIKNVPYNASGYDVVVEGRKVSDEKTVAGLGWSYLSRERSNLSEDENEGNFAHGRLEFVSAKYTDIDGEEHTFNSVNAYNNARFHDTGEIYMWYDGRKDYEEVDRRQAWGSASVPYGTELTVRIVPDAGYQLVGLAKAPTGFTATDEVGVYKMTLTRENFKYADGGFDLQPVFVEIGNEVQSVSEAVSGGSININQNVENGNIKLEVTDVNLAGDRREAFEGKAEEEGYEISNYVDLSLYNAIYKGGKKDNNGNYLSWDTEINNLNKNARITLNLEDDMLDKEVALIHETHDGDRVTGYELVEVEYDDVNNAITFEVNGFSNYAIVSREIEEPEVGNEEELEVMFDLKGGSFDGPIGLFVKKGEKIEQPIDPTNGDLVFGGWYLDEAYHDEFDFNTPVEQNIVLYAKWDEKGSEKDTNYTVADEGGNQIQFTEENGHEYNLHIANYLGLTEEELPEGVSKELYDQVFEMLTEATKDEGTLVAFYEIEVEDEDGHFIHEGPFKIRIKLTEEMKKYNTFKLIYVDDDFNLGEITNLTINGDYLEGTLDHLSKYSLVGSYVESETTPNTIDNIYMWIVVFMVAMTGLTYTIISIKKRIN